MLLIKAEKILYDKLMRLFKRKIAEIKKHSDIKMDYEQKTKFLEEEIERTMEYLAKDTGLSDYLKIKYAVQKVNKGIAQIQRHRTVK